MTKVVVLLLPGALEVPTLHPDPMPGCRPKISSDWVAAALRVACPSWRCRLGRSDARLEELEPEGMGLVAAGGVREGGAAGIWHVDNCGSRRWACDDGRAQDGGIVRCGGDVDDS